MSLFGYSPLPLNDSQYVEQTSGAARWFVQPAWLDSLLGDEGLRLDEWLSTGQARLVKRGAHRAIYRLELPAGCCYLKHYRSPTIADYARNWFRSSPSRREFCKARELAARGIATIEPIALGEITSHGWIGESYLLTAAIPGAISLLDWQQRVLPTYERRQQQLSRAAVSDALARLCVQLHRAGVVHNDLHAGNILIPLDESQPTSLRSTSIKLYLVDLPGVQFSGPLDWPRSRDNLLTLASDWSQRSTLGERWRFWRRYWLERAELRLADRRAAAQEIATGTRDYGCRVLGSRVRRALRANRDFHICRHGEQTGHAITALPASELAALTARPERLFEQAWDRPVKLSPSSLIVRGELPLDGVPTAVAYKRCRPKTLTKQMIAWGGRNRAVHAWVMGHALLERGIATPRPVALVVPGEMRAAGVGYLATEWIADGLNLHLYLWQLAKRPAAERAARRRQLATALGALLGRLHAWRVAHRDLKGCNVLVRERAGSIETLLVDLDGVRIRRQLSEREQVLNLARLAASAEAHDWLRLVDRVRFLRAYVAELAPQTVDRRKLFSAVARASQQIIARFEREQKAIA